MIRRQFDQTITPGGDKCPEAGDRVRMQGNLEHIAIDEAKANNPECLAKRAVAAIQFEIDKHHEIIGGPISVLLIKKSGLTWLRPGLCN